MFVKQVQFSFQVSVTCFCAIGGGDDDDDDDVDVLNSTWKLTLQDINTTPKELKTERDCSHRQLFRPVWGSSVWRNNQRSGSDEKISAHSDGCYAILTSPKEGETAVHGYGLRYWGVFQFTQVQLLPSHHKQCWTRVSRIFSQFQLCIGWWEGGGGGVGGEGELLEDFEKDALL